MLIYQFSCDDCENQKGNDDELFDKDENKDGYHPNGDFIFFIKAPMSAIPKFPRCPRCNGIKTRRNYLDNIYQCWVRGDGLVKDKEGARRDMNKHTLINNDPYSYMRQSGEVDHMIKQFENAGKDMAKIREQRRKNNKSTKRFSKFKILPKEQHSLLLKIAGYDNGCPYDDLNGFDDVNKLLSDLIPDYICKLKGGIFKVMAEGRSYIEKCELEDIK